MSQLVMMSEQKLQVKHRSKRWQELSPGSAPTNLPSQLARVGMCRIKRGQGECGGHREGQSCPGSTSTQVNKTFLSYMWVETSWDCWVLQHPVPRSSVGAARSAVLWEILGHQEPSPILGAFGQSLSREGKLLPRLTESFSKYMLKCVNS